MLPLAIPAIASVAGSAVQAWKGVAKAKAAAQSPTLAEQPKKADFSTVLAQANSAGGSQGIQSQLAALPEVKAALASSSPGTQVKFNLSGQSLFRVSSNGTQQAIALSSASQNAVRGLTAMNPGAASSVTLTA